MATKKKAKKSFWKRIRKGGDIYEVWVGALPRGKAPKRRGKVRKSEFTLKGLRGETEIRELSLFMDNEQPIYRQLQSIDLNQAKKVCKGVWDVQKSAKLYQYAVDEAARRYGQQFGSGRSLKTAPFSVSDRKQLALDLANDFKQRITRCSKGQGCGDVSADVLQALKKCNFVRPGTLAGLGRTRRR